MVQDNLKCPPLFFKFSTSRVERRASRSQQSQKIIVHLVSLYLPPHHQLIFIVCPPEKDPPDPHSVRRFQRQCVYMCVRHILILRASVSSCHEPKISDMEFPPVPTIISPQKVSISPGTSADLSILPAWKRGQQNGTTTLTNRGGTKGLSSSGSHLDKPSVLCPGSGSHELDVHSLGLCPVGSNQ